MLKKFLLLIIVSLFLVASAFAGPGDRVVEGILADTVDSEVFNLGVAGVKLSHDSDGSIIFTGMGDGYDEDLKLNLDDTENTGVFSSSTGLTALDWSGILLKNIADPIVSGDAVNLSTLLEHVSIALNYWFGNATLDRTLTDSEDVLLETPDADPKTLTTILFKSTVADLPTPFTVVKGAIISLHFAADVTTVAGKHDEQLQFQLGYVDADGTTGFTQIGTDSELTPVLTATKITYDIHIHVTSDITVPSGKRLWLKVIADATLSGASYPEINFYYDAADHHLNFGLGGEVLDNFVLKSGDTMTGVLTVKPDGANEVFEVNDGTLDFTDGAGGTTGTMTIDANGNITYNKAIFIKDVDFIPIGYCKDGGAPPEDIATISSTNDVEARNFDPGSDEDVFCTWQVPKDFSGTSITFQMILIVSNATAPAAGEGVSFFMKGNSLGSGDILSTALDGTVDSSVEDLDAIGVDAQYDIAYTPYSAAVTISNLAAGELAILNVYRDISDPDDDYAQDIGAIGFNIKYQKAMTND